MVFARMNGDENESCMEFLRIMEVVEVPTFVFIRDGKICGRYVGSGKGEFIGEILRYQGVRVTLCKRQTEILVVGRPTYAYKFWRHDCIATFISRVLQTRDDLLVVISFLWLFFSYWNYYSNLHLE